MVKLEEKGQELNSSSQAYRAVSFFMKGIPRIGLKATTVLQRLANFKNMLKIPIVFKQKNDAMQLMQKKLHQRIKIDWSNPTA